MDSHTLEAVIMAVEAGIVEAYLVGDVASIEPFLLDKPELWAHIHIVDKPEVKEATLEAELPQPAREAANRADTASRETKRVSFIALHLKNKIT